MKYAIPVVAAALLLAGCDKETTLHAGLAERQANLVMAALIDAGIGCHKSPGEEGTWDVTVVESRFADAVNLLEKAGLPRNDHQGIGEVFKKTGMISSPSACTSCCRRTTHSRAMRCRRPPLSRSARAGTRT